MMKSFFAWFGNGRPFGFRVYALNLLVVSAALLAFAYVASPRVPRRIGPDGWFGLLLFAPVLAAVTGFNQLVFNSLKDSIASLPPRWIRAATFGPSLIVVGLLGVLMIFTPRRTPFDLVLAAPAPASVRDLRCDGQSTLLGNSEWVLSCALSPPDLDALFHAHSYRANPSEEEVARLERLAQKFLGVGPGALGRPVFYRCSVDPDHPPGRHGVIVLAVSPAHDRLVACDTSD